MSKTQFAYPVDKLCGKISKHSKVIHRCGPGGKQLTYLQGERNMENHPVLPGETKAHDLFRRRQLAVAARQKKTSATYETDLQAYHTQLKDSEQPIVGFQAYLWSLVKTEITE